VMTTQKCERSLSRFASLQRLYTAIDTLCLNWVLLAKVTVQARIFTLDISDTISPYPSDHT
jgi:hypothetical protein